MPPEQLTELVERLERAAAQLRAGDIDATRAAGLVDECARLAAEAGSALDAEMRGAEPSPGQLRLAP